MRIKKPIGFVHFFVFAILLNSCAWFSESHLAENGVVDLRGVDLSNRVVRLDGEWRFVWTATNDTLFIQQPASWVSGRSDGKSLPKEGSGTYNLRILIDSMMSGPLVISTKEINSQSRIFLNGRQIPDIGSSALQFEFTPESNTIDLEIQVQNTLDVRPGIPSPFYLGNQFNMELRSQFLSAFQTFLLGMFALLTILYFASWWFRRKERSSLLLGVNSLVWGAYTFFQGVSISPAAILFPSLSIIAQQKGYIIATAFSFPLICLLWLELFPSRLFKRFLPILIIVSAGYSIWVLFQSQIHWIWFERFIVFGDVYLFVLFGLVVAAVGQKKPGAKVFLAGFAILLMVVYTGTVLFRGEWIGIGGLALMLADSILLTKRRAKAFETIAEQRDQLERVSRLKEELATTVQEKFHLAVKEERLSKLLNLVDSPILVLSEDETVYFANQQMVDLLGYTFEDISGMSWSSLCSHESIPQGDFRSCVLRRARGQNLVCSLRQADLIIGHDSMLVLLLQKAGGVNVSPEAHAETTNPQALACSIMQLCLEIWELCTQLTKADFAEASGLWKVHMDPNGWRRTLTLDKYLEELKIPKLPKWRKVIDSAEYALTTAKFYQWDDPRVGKLQDMKQQLTLWLG